MANVTAMVVKLDNGKYRSVRLSKVRSIFTDPKARCQGTMHQGDPGAFGPETDEPDFAPQSTEGTATTRGGDGGDDGFNCYYVNGVIVCI